MEWDMDDDDTLFANGGERLTITLGVAELVPGTYVYLDADDEIIMRGALVDNEDLAHGVLLARVDFGDDLEDADPDGRTIIGPLLAPREPALVLKPARTSTLKGPAIRPRQPVPTPDQIRNEIDDDDDDDDVGGRTLMGPLMTPRRPAPRRK
jgi:hypothetical protein